MKNYYLGREEAYIASPQVWSFRSEPEIDYDLLQQSNIYLFGKKLSFE